MLRPVSNLAEAADYERLFGAEREFFGVTRFLLATFVDITKEVLFKNDRSLPIDQRSFFVISTDKERSHLYVNKEGDGTVVVDRVLLGSPAQGGQEA